MKKSREERMHRYKQPMEIEHTETGTIEIRYFDNPRRPSYLCWQIPKNEAESLAKWWAIEGSQIRKKQRPVREKKFGSVLISMFTCSGLVNVKGLAKYGKPNMLGYSLPRTVVKKLSAWLQDKRNFSETKDRISNHV
jgi:hypothetical protein